jgi:hypothetical protein
MLLFSTTLIIAQTNVIKRVAAKSNNYGVNYFLPKTTLEIQVFTSKIEEKAGPYYRYAEKYLGVNNAIIEDKTFYELDDIQVNIKAVPDKDKSYIVELKQGTTAPFVYLTEDGLICTINAEYVPPVEKTAINGKATAASSNSKLSPEALFTQEYLQAGSTAKMAEIAAKQIYKIRESRLDILTGNADNAPPDGVAMKLVLEQLDAQEKALVELFTGTSSRSSAKTVIFILEPKFEMEKQIIFRFSKHLGIVDHDDLSGQPVYLNLRKIETVDLIPDDTKKKDKNADKGVFYNIPGRGEVEIYLGTNRIYRGVFDITQFGTTHVLANPIFENKKSPVRVYFYPETGGIKKIEQ